MSHYGYGTKLPVYMNACARDTTLPWRKQGVDMIVGGEYRFKESQTTVLVTGFTRKHLRTYVVFATLYNGEQCGGPHEILRSYAKKNWIPVLTQTHSMS